MPLLNHVLNNTHMDPLDLSRRERQIMHVIYAQGEATATEIRAAMPDPPAYSGVRTILRVLVDKGHLEYTRDGTRYVYRAVNSRHAVRRAALREMIGTFFGGSPRKAMLALLDEEHSLDPDTERRLRALMQSAKERKP